MTTASWKEKHLTEMIQPSALRAPEVTIGAPWDSKVDIWSLGCLVHYPIRHNCLDKSLTTFEQIIEFTHGLVLFKGQESEKGTWTVDDDRLARTIGVLGPFPPGLLAQGTRTAEYFNDRGSSPSLRYKHKSNSEGMVKGSSIEVGI